MKTMYPAMVNSPEVVTRGELTATNTEIQVSDGGVLSVIALPFPATLGKGSTAETVLITAINSNILTVQRGFEGTARAWETGTSLARNFTAYDHNAFRENLNENTQVIVDLVKDIADKVNKIDGKGLSTNDYTTEEKEKVSNALITFDIVNNLTSDSADKPLSAAQGKALKNSIVSSNYGNAYLSIKSLGCVGDGKTDDTAAFQEAINTAILDGKILYIDSGTYLTTGRLYIKAPITILGVSNQDAVIKHSVAAYEAEVAYDLVNYEESHAAISIQSDNVMLSNFKLVGGESKATASTWNGIIFHYPHTNTDTNVTNYHSAERTNISQLNIEGFRNGIFIYAGWNRYIVTAEIKNCSEAGIQYKPLELTTVGRWSASGDIIQSCQIIGCEIGYKATGNYESTIQNTIFEYNTRAFWIYSCKDIYLNNCWNEANTNKLYVAGSARIKGGYNITPETVEHVNIYGNDAVTIELDNDVYVKQGDNIQFYQTGGIITKGVSLGSERINMLTNTTFGTIAVPDLTGWQRDTQWLVTIDTETKYDTDHNSIKIKCDPSEGWTTEPDYGFNSEAITIDSTENYYFNFKLYTPDRSTINKNVHITFISMKGTEVLGYSKVGEFTPAANTVWEDYTFAFNATTLGYASATAVKVRIYVKQFGIVYVSNPVFAKVNVTSNNLELKKTDTAGVYSIVDINGNIIATINGTVV